jgi:3',5'-cyclic AMP phosphodiesterase CpdA
VRIVQFSDTHLSHLGGTPSENLSLLVDFLNAELRPDLVIHTGDIVILNPDSPDDRQAAWRLHQQINAPLLVLPGNHDVGESGDDVWMGVSVTSDRVAGFAGTWGADRFFRLGDADTGSQDWAFIGINSERMSSGLPEEDDQWDWLAGVADQVRGKSVMLFLHKPLWLLGRAEAGMTIPEPDRERLLSVLAGTRLRVVANGHLHRYRHAYEGDLLTIWSPSLTFAMPPSPEYRFGASLSGIVEYQIDGDVIEAEFRAVPGLEGVADAASIPGYHTAMAEVEAMAASR